MLISNCINVYDYFHLGANFGGLIINTDLEDFNGNKAYAKYSTFYVGGAATKYKLHVGGYSGTAGKLVLRRLLPYLLSWERGIW
jgi:hypothetical protein